MTTFLAKYSSSRYLNNYNTKIKSGFRQFINSDATASSISDSDHREIKPFSSIPGPKGPFGLGTLIEYSFGDGPQKWNELHKMGFKNYCQYGPIVKERIMPGVNVVWLFDPDDIATVLNDYSKTNFPRRHSHIALAKFREDRPDFYNDAGLLPTSGEQWWRIRSELQKKISKPKEIRNFAVFADQICSEFIQRLSSVVHKNSTIDVLPWLNLLNLELIIFLTFGIRFNAFSRERQSDTEVNLLVEATNHANSSTLLLDQKLPFWKWFPDKNYKSFEESISYIESIAIKLLDQCLATTDETGYTPLAKYYLQNTNLNQKDLMGMALDFLLAGIDTTSYTTGFLLYHLAKNKSVQSTLYEEVKTILLNADDQLDPEKLNNFIPYSRAVLKESLRLNPVSIGVGRILTKDSIIGGYFIPKNSRVVTQNFVSCRLPQYFRNPLEFIPERWLKKDTKEDRDLIHKYLVLPFGHGMRSCIARRFAEQNILITMIRMTRKFDIEWHGVHNELELETKLINKPKDPVLIRLKER